MKAAEKKLRRFINKLSYKLLAPLLSVSFFFLLLSIYGKDALKKIEVGEIAGWVNTIEYFAAPVLNFFDLIFVKILVLFGFIVILTLKVCKIILRPKVIIINHSTFSNTQSKCDENIGDGAFVKERDIDLVEQMKKHDIVDAVRKQDKIVRDILRECDEFTELFYYGIAHIPLIFRAGFQIGDEGNVRLMHKHRNEQAVFKEISSEADDHRVQLKVNHRKLSNGSQEMLVVVATSFQVSTDDLAVFSNNNIGHSLRFEMEAQSMYGVDSIVSYAVMNRLRTGILNKIRNVVATENIEKIHLVLSTSSDFTFFLSQGFSKYHDPEIIVYQYERSNPIKYPWGVSNKARPASGVICQK